ncbi:UDP-N-acetylglucosamine 2-epimerase [Candidatus Daviesbacteria bacterium]|nr:UDP-N-acetylglucosamine 2-epimerase [Candidatus Daviesbacteria bacterium]
MNKKIIYLFLGTTAELIKVAPVIKRLKDRKVDLRIITSGQNQVNFKLLEPLIGKQDAYNSFKVKLLKIPLGIYLEFAVWIIKAFTNYLLFFRNEFKGVDKKNILFIVHGDTISALLGAIIAKLNGLKLVHIESGYRSFKILEPFPEEFCRFVVSRLSDILFCPNYWCLNNVKNNKGIKINTGQNTVFESCMSAINLRTDYSLPLRGKFFLLVLHRQEHMIFKKELAKKYLNLLLSFANANLKCLFVLHPITENFLKNENMLEQIKKNQNIVTVPRIPYLKFMKVLSKCEFIATDGGSNQQEAYFLGKPCLLLRKYTEQIEGLYSNATLAKDDLNIVEDFLLNYKKKISKKISVKVAPSKIIVDTLLKI